jgi:hypothetical protein
MKLLLFLLLIKSFPASYEDSGIQQADSLLQVFSNLKAGFNNEIFYDPFTSPWQNKWFLDGEKAVLTHSEKGLDFWAGPDALDDASHAVLWTHQVFSGDIMIEYEFTRLDEEVRYVNIIYLQATGSGEEGFDEDITLWKEKRKVPAMHNYFRNMNTFHISYAAFGTRNDNPELDYLRARRYMPQYGSLRETDLEPDYAETGLFQTGMPHTIIIIKKENQIYMHVTKGEQSRLFYWKNDRLPPISEGRIGLRHMYTRGARYSDFKISVPGE